MFFLEFNPSKTWLVLVLRVFCTRQLLTLEKKDGLQQVRGPQWRIKTIWKLSVPVPWVIMSYVQFPTCTHSHLLTCAVRNLKITENKDWHMICCSHNAKNGILLVRATTFFLGPKSILQRLCINKGKWTVSPNGAIPVEIQRSRSFSRYSGAQQPYLIYVELDVCEGVYSWQWVCKAGYTLTKRVNKESRRWLVPRVGVTAPIMSSGDPFVF